MNIQDPEASAQGSLFADLIDSEMLMNFIQSSLDNLKQQPEASQAEELQLGDSLAKLLVDLGGESENTQEGSEELHETPSGMPSNITAEQVDSREAVSISRQM